MPCRRRREPSNLVLTSQADLRERAGMKTLSVILLNYNQAHWLRRSLRAHAEQADEQTEIIVVDDGSYGRQRRRHRAHGAGLSGHQADPARREQGVSGRHADRHAAATGEFLLFAAADDLVLPGLFETAIAALRAHPRSRAVLLRHGSDRCRRPHLRLPARDAAARRCRLRVAGRGPPRHPRHRQLVHRLERRLPARASGGHRLLSTRRSAACPTGLPTACSRSSTASVSSRRCFRRGGAMPAATPGRSP